MMKMPRCKPPTTEWQRFLNWFSAGNPEPAEGTPDHEMYLAMRDMSWAGWMASLDAHQVYFNEFF